MYLRKGIQDDKIPALFSSGKETNNRSVKAKSCNSIEDSGWWYIYYCIKLVYHGNDEFSEGPDQAASEHIDKLKDILFTHVKAIKLPINDLNCDVNNEKRPFDINGMKSLDEAIRNEFSLKELSIRKKIEEIKQASVEMRVQKLASEEKTLLELNEKLKEEMKTLQNVIKEGEVLLTTKKNTLNTTETKYKRFITGEEKHMLEDNLSKKEEKTIGALLLHSEKNRNSYIEKEMNWKNENE